MNEDHTASAEGLIDETADRGHPYENIFVMRVLNGDTHVSYTRLRVLGGDGFGTNRDDMCDTALCQRAGRLCRNKAKEWEGVIRDQSSWRISKMKVLTFPNRAVHQ